MHGANSKFAPAYSIFYVGAYGIVSMFRVFVVLLSMPEERQKFHTNCTPPWWGLFPRYASQIKLFNTARGVAHVAFVHRGRQNQEEKRKKKFLEAFCDYLKSFKRLTLPAKIISQGLRFQLKELASATTARPMSEWIRHRLKNAVIVL